MPGREAQVLVIQMIQNSPQLKSRHVRRPQAAQALLQRQGRSTEPVQGRAPATTDVCWRAAGSQ